MSDATGKVNPFIKAAALWTAATNPPKARKAFSKGLDRVAHLIVADAKKRAPVLTGALRASGRVRFLNHHSRVIEFGGRGTGVDYAAAVEFGTFRTRPQPFLRPALMAMKPKMKAILTRQVQIIFPTFSTKGEVKLKL